MAVGDIVITFPVLLSTGEIRVKSVLRRGVPGYYAHVYTDGGGGREIGRWGAGAVVVC